MTLARWSRWLLVGAGAGFVFLAVLGVWAQVSHRAFEERVDTLVALQTRADALSVEADALLVEPFDEAVWNAFVASAQALQVDLDVVAGTDGAAGDAIAATAGLVAAVEGVLVGLDASWAGADGVVGPLGVPVSIARSMQVVAAAGTELDAAFDALFLADFAGGATQAHVATFAFAVAAMLFAALSVALLQVLWRRVGAPLSALVGVADRVAAGERAARADVERRDEVGQLGRSLNAMLDALGASERALVEQREALVLEKERLALSQRIARVATWSWAPEDDAVTLSEEAFAIVGREPDSAAVPVAELVAVVHEDDRLRFVGEVVEGLDRGQTVSAVFRVARPDGDVRTLRVNGEPRVAGEGAPRVVGTVQDVTDEVALRRAAEAQARLLRAAGSVARFGGWSVDTRTWAMEWSDVVCEIHEVPLGTSPAPERGIEYYAPEFRERIREVFEACVREGVPYDEEMQIVTARGRLLWVRTTGSAVRDEHGVIVRVEGAFQDIDARKQAQLSASVAERRLRETIESLADPFVLVDQRGAIVFANAAAATHAGAARDALLGEDACTVLQASLPTDERSALERAFADRVPYAAEVLVPESERWFEVRLDPVDGVSAFQARDVTERRSMLERLRRHEHELRVSRDALAVALESQRATFDALPANVAVLDGSGVIEYVNAGWRDFGDANGLHDRRHGVGVDYLAVVDRSADADESARAAASGLRRVIAGEVEAFELEYPCHGPDAEAWFRMSARRVDGSTNGTTRVVVMHVDITERMLAERALAYVAHNDPLTTLLSRAGFARHVRGALERHWQPQGIIAALDLMGFRSINDAHGYAVGDALLQVVAQRLTKAIGEGGVAARVGGDSFAVSLDADVAHDGAERAVQNLVERVFGAPLEVGDFAFQLDVAIGYTRLGAEVRSVEELLREAEVALYDGVNAADGGVAAYTSELDAASRARARTTSELKDALTRNEFELHFQPKVDLTSGALLAAEALIRWRHPERGLVPPGAFIAVAEQSGLIAPIGSWVLEQACRTIAGWQRDGLPRVRIAVNVSVRQLVQGDFATEVEQVIERFAIAPADLTLEITESVYGSESLHLRRQLHRLHALGIQLALDDFGTGFSSLQYLKAYRFDEVKIDRSFVRDMVRDTYSRNVIETILGIARAIGAEAVAEGIETERQRDLLASMGCRIGQGYFFSTPVPEDDFRWLLQRQATLPVTLDVAERSARRRPS